ncbi:3017_t:CDS:2 [Entrophospora sp. SA101]|nr:8619_t:CDS:2 [Entrophospora candida]CAH1759778.1 11846_t:CDS:2 [Entrophospora sp. SA101]CAG8571153.1 4865_t:CDS:2 [Entrophospora candida]CAJ0627082.1 1220_t:CDS:2 [Entrophospora sp. SA101]CAJ0756999.1 8157_t:CDS:2 [Entrophospora sp. SA101]
MSLPEDALHKVLMELQTRLLENNRQLNIVKTQIQTKEREKRFAELTKHELSSLNENIRTYKSVGKAFIKTDINILKSDLETTITKTVSDLTALGKSKKYIERNISDSEAGLREIIGRPLSNIDNKP